MQTVFIVLLILSIMSALLLYACILAGSEK